uniref:Polymerase/primase n=1 Tax=Dulem virus 38 TaxID=3145756 RepID=A0AAU8B355_9CAUD
MSITEDHNHAVVEAALDAYRRGMTPIPVPRHSKGPTMAGWNKLRWPDPETDPGNGEVAVRKAFEEYTAGGSTNLGVVLGEASGDLIDVDLDHPTAQRLKSYLLPYTAAVHGRETSRASHFWYRAKPGTLPSTRRLKIPAGEGSGVSVEIRGNGAQTLVPPSIHPATAETYCWEKEPWGGEEGPALVDGTELLAQVILLGLCAVLLDAWPRVGQRHDAYVALAGGLLRYGDSQTVHPFWERNAALVIRTLAQATHDEDGPDQRVREAIYTTQRRLREGGEAVGFTRLGEIIGEESAQVAQRLVRDAESVAGFVPDVAGDVPGWTPPWANRWDGLTIELDDSAPAPAFEEGGDSPRSAGNLGPALASGEDAAPKIPTEDLLMEGEDVREGLDPLDARPSSWSPVDLEPYLTGKLTVPDPEVCRRTDGACLMYRGRVNMLFGSSESAKSWIAMAICLQEIEAGGRALYLDFEDEPVQTLNRLRLLGAVDDDLRAQFSYIRPEGPLADMQRNKWGKDQPTRSGEFAQDQFDMALQALDPDIIVADGMTALYGLHGLDANDAVSTDVITSWLKRLTRNGRSTVIIIDHQAKSAEKGSMPIGSQHKVAMVQGTLLQVWPIKQPMPGDVGEMELVVLKDRPGQVRAHSQKTGGRGKAQVAGVVTLDSRTEGHSSLMISAPRRSPLGGGTLNADGEDVNDVEQRVELDFTEMSRAMETIARNGDDEEAVIAAFGGEVGIELTSRDVFDLLDADIPRSRSKAAIDRLKARGWISATSGKGGRRYTLVAVGDDGPEEKEEEDAGA